MQGDSLFRDYRVYCRDLSAAFKVSLPAKSSLLEPQDTVGLSSLADFAHCCQIILRLVTLDARLCLVLLLMAALSSSNMARSITGWSPSPESLHLAAPLIFQSSCAPVPVCLWEMESHYLPSWHMLISLITFYLQFDAEAHLFLCFHRSARSLDHGQ